MYVYVCVLCVFVEIGTQQTVVILLIWKCKSQTCKGVLAMKNIITIADYQNKCYKQIHCNYCLVYFINEYEYGPLPYSYINLTFTVPLQHEVFSS